MLKVNQGQDLHPVTKGVQGSWLEGETSLSMTNKGCQFDLADQKLVRLGGDQDLFVQSQANGYKPASLPFNQNVPFLLDKRARRFAKLTFSDITMSFEESLTFDTDTSTSFHARSEQ